MKLSRQFTVLGSAVFCVVIFSLYLMLDRGHFDHPKSPRREGTFPKVSAAPSGRGRARANECPSHREGRGRRGRGSEGGWTPTSCPRATTPGVAEKHGCAPRRLRRPRRGGWAGGAGRAVPPLGGAAERGAGREGRCCLRRRRGWGRPRGARARREPSSRPRRWNRKRSGG